VRFPSQTINNLGRESIMTITESAYVAALEKKLIEAERALYGFRAIFNNYRDKRVVQCEEPTDGTRTDLYPGQLSDPSECVE
jgi:hypothetical protein